MGKKECCGHGLTRKRFLKVGGAACLITASAPACDFLSTAPKQEGARDEQNGAVGRKGKEAPQLAEMVKNGELPPLEERLPKNPMVVEPVERVGRYGGDWRYMLLQGGCPECLLERTIGYENLVRWTPDVRAFTVEELIPNVVESFEFNDQATEYTFKLREGMKWSDGEPFTADDILFWYEDMLMNQELSPEVPTWLTAGGEPVVVEKVDDYAVVFRFSAPNGLFLQKLATGDGIGVGTRPAHYLKQFHPKYNEDVKEQAKEENLDNWMALFQNQSSAWLNPDLPVLYSWVLTKGLGGDVQRLIAERNPYCWKVDSEGNQLPYIDRVVYGVVLDGEVLTLKALNGEIDMQITYVGDLQDKPVVAENRERGNYHFVDQLSTYMNTAPLVLNLAHKDEVKRRIFQNKDFRIGLSHAINRREIIDVTLVSQGEPFQCAPRPESPFYNEELAKQYTGYDVEKANEHLDKVLPEKDSDGMRLGPDGRPFRFTMDVAGEKPPDDLELVRQYWKAVGIDITIKPVTFDLMFTRMEGNEHDAIKGYGDGGLDVILDPRSYFPANSLSWFAVPWVNWYLQGGLEGNVETSESVQEPPEAAKRQMELYDRLIATADPDEQADLIGQILDIAVEQFWMMGVSLPVEAYGIAKNNFHNVPKVLVSPGVSSNPGMPNAAQYFVTEE
jgi:peptide/nickel transport system substrate-binding protein